MLWTENNSIYYRYDAEQLVIIPWGKNSVRVRATKNSTLPEQNWALVHTPACNATLCVTDDEAVLKNGELIVRITNSGRITFYDWRGNLLLKEYWRNRSDVTAPDCSALEIEAREFRPNVGGDYHLTMRFESLDPKEKLYGMGQYQQPYLNIKGMDLELAHRNSQASVPFLISSRGYGLLWNNPAIGRAVLGNNVMSFEALSTKALDYWVTAGDHPADLLQAYSAVTGTVPMMPEYGLGFWQCKLRYQTQEELLNVAREYKRRGLPIDVIVVDFFHWPKQGEWKFDPVYWPHPEAMIQELEQMGIKLMVSIWPTVDRDSELYAQMLERGYLIRTERGFRVGLNFEGATIHYDATNPEARAYLWRRVKEQYYDKGVRVFWLDEAEPEYTVYDFDNYRYYLGTDLEIGNVYPLEYARTFYEGMKHEGQQNIINLLRCAWAGSQRFGALVWSGDIASSFSSMKNQLAAGLSMGLSGIPWWTTDIGGFHGGDPNDPAFRELFIRWFQWATYCPVMRLHGDREPRQPQYGESGGAHCCSGADNEVWSYGREAYAICCDYLAQRENMRGYIRTLMQQAHETGDPVMRTLFYEFSEDPICWDVEDEYLFGDRYLVAPVLEAGARARRLYLPAGCSWREQRSGKQYSGGQWITLEAPLNYMPVLERCQY